MTQIRCSPIPRGLPLEENQKETEPARRERKVPGEESTDSLWKMATKRVHSHFQQSLHQPCTSKDSGDHKEAVTKNGSLLSSSLWYTSPRGRNQHTRDELMEDGLWRA